MRALVKKFACEGKKFACEGRSTAATMVELCIPRLTNKAVSESKRRVYTLRTMNPRGLRRYVMGGNVKNATSIPTVLGRYCGSSVAVGGRCKGFIAMVVATVDRRWLFVDG